MTTAEVVQVLTASVGKVFLVAPVNGEPERVRIISVDDEGFSYHILTDPALCDPNTKHWYPYSDVADVRPVTT